MSGPGAPQPLRGEGDHFAQAARDPAGTEYFVQAVVACGGSGPVWIGHSDDPFKFGRVLQLVNRALAKVQRPHHFEAAMVTVTRVHDREVVVQEEAPTTAEAFQRAEAIVSQIEAGTFRG